jgi:hypothetical protein
MFGNLFDLATNVVKVVVAPVEVVAHVANAAVKPIAEGVAEVVKDVKESL